MNNSVIKLAKRVENRWSPMEDDILFAEVLKAGHTICWRKVAAALPGRTNKSCRKRWIHSLDPNLRKGRWSASEDASLMAAVNIHGKHWYQVARTLNNGRTDDQCAKRWREALDPSIRKDGWTDQEDELLVQVFMKVGRKWNEIAAALSGRPPVQCRNRWLSLARAGRFEDLSIEDEPRLQSAGSPYEFSLGDYDPVSAASSRRPSTSSTCSSMSFMPSTPAFTPSPTLHAPYLTSNPQFQFPDWNSTSSGGYNPDEMLSHLPSSIIPDYQSYEHSFQPSCPWEKNGNYTHLPSSAHLREHAEYPEYTDLASLSPLSLLCDTSIALGGMSQHISMPIVSLASSPPLSGRSSFSEASSSFPNDVTHSSRSATITVDPALSGCVGPIHNAHNNMFYQQHGDNNLSPDLYIDSQPARGDVGNNESGSSRNGIDRFVMSCPVQSCSYYSHELLDIWRHITWDHVSCRRSKNDNKSIDANDEEYNYGGGGDEDGEDDEDEAGRYDIYTHDEVTEMVEKLVLGEASGRTGEY